MGKPHNWEETDSLLEKLRAKINEDTSEPASPASEPESAEKAPERIPEPNANIPLAGRKKRKSRPRPQPFENRETTVDGAKNAEKTQETVTAPKPVQAYAAPAPQSTAPAPQSTAPAPQSTPPAAQPTPVSDKPATEPTAADADANMTRGKGTSRKRPCNAPPGGKGSRGSPEKRGIARHRHRYIERSVGIYPAQNRASARGERTAGGRRAGSVCRVFHR